MSISQTVHAIAFRLKTLQHAVLYILAFPDAWMRDLLELERMHSPGPRNDFWFPTKELQSMLSWLDGVMKFKLLRQNSQDQLKCTSFLPFDEDKLKLICSLVKIWVIKRYKENAKGSEKKKAEEKNAAEEFCSKHGWEELLTGLSSQNVLLTREDETVTQEAFDMLPLMAVHCLLGKKIMLRGQVLTLHYLGGKQLISQPITDPESGHAFSYVFSFSVQTTPPTCRGLLLCHMSIRRWIPGTTGEPISYLAESIRAHIAAAENKYCVVPLGYNQKSRQVEWNALTKACYDSCSFTSLPEAAELLKHPEKYQPWILLTYKDGITNALKSLNGPGVSIADKAELYDKLAALLPDGMVEGNVLAFRVTKKGRTFGLRQERSMKARFKSTEAFRAYACRCMETNLIVFELHGHLKDPNEAKMLDDIEKQLLEDFGENSPSSCMTVVIEKKEIGQLADAMEDNTTASVLKRCDEVCECMGPAKKVTACIVVLPGRKAFEIMRKGDPKAALRIGFARTERLTQFITPETDPDAEVEQEKIKNTVYDLYRQLGLVTLADPVKGPPFAAFPSVGMYACTQVRGFQGKNKKHSLIWTVEVRVKECQVRVHCNAFPLRKTLSYREACLEFAKLFWTSETDLENRCVDNWETPVEQELSYLTGLYRSPEDQKALLLVQSENMRSLWYGISDKATQGYHFLGEYCPERIDIRKMFSNNNSDKPNPRDMVPLRDKGLRIIRIRRSEEVPDYFTERSGKGTEDNPIYVATSGVFRFDDVFWSIRDRPNDANYTDSYKKSKIDFPQSRFAEKDMIEFYPLQLQPGDDAAEWIFYARALQDLSIQYSRATNLPLPLHLAKALAEYLYQG